MRVKNSIAGGSDDFYFNGADGRTEVINLAANNFTYNILGAGGDNIGQLKVQSESPESFFYLKDHLGSVRMTTDNDEDLVGYDDFYPYCLQMTGRSNTSQGDARYQFTGKELDATDGLYYFGKRYYDPWNGRWDQVDPM
jgi:RHS repeat-associated protein